MSLETRTVSYLKAKYSDLNRRYLGAYESRDKTIGEGFLLNDVHFEVHRFHPPLIYGRIANEAKDVGIALTKVCL